MKLYICNVHFRIVINQMFSPIIFIASELGLICFPVTSLLGFEEAEHTYHNISSFFSNEIISIYKYCNTKEKGGKKEEKGRQKGKGKENV